MRIRAVILGLWLVALGSARATAPFAVTTALDRVTQGWQVRVGVEMPARHYLFADAFRVSVSGGRLESRHSPPTVLKPDPEQGGERAVYERSFEAVYALHDWDGDERQPLDLTVDYQGCNDNLCFLPRRVTFRLTGAGLPASPVTAPPSGVARDGSPWTGGWRVQAHAAGFLDVPAFLALLDRAEGRDAGAAPAGGLRGFVADPQAFLQRHGVVWTILLVLLGGLLLNLTPCVLPLIPINLGLIGAGAQAGSRARGLLFGTAYGCGIALVYGLLGLAVLLSGSFFGTIQSSPWFNLAIAVVFVLLALALFDVFLIDLTRFQRAGAGGRGLAAALTAGGISALLAGACVAPVVLAVLLLAGSLYAAGVGVALALPFLLGVGMALPWPLAGAGLAFLPKPGAWMSWIKYGFGVVVVLFGLHYGRLAWKGFGERRAAAPDSIAAGDIEAWQEQLRQAAAEGRPVLVDFWATWCKSCHGMDRTTLADPVVRQRLARYRIVKVQAEKPGQSPAREMLEAMQAAGLPAFAVLVAEER